MRSVVDGRVVRGGVAVGLTGLVLALSAPGTASAAAPVKVECGSSASVPSGSSIQLTLLGVPLGGVLSAGGTGTNVLTAPISQLLGTVCKVVVTVVDPVVAAVPTAATDPIATAVAPVASAVQAAPPVAVPVPGVATVQVGSGAAAGSTPGSTAPGTAAGTGTAAGAGGTTTGTSGTGGTSTPGTSSVTGAVAGAGAPALLPGAAGGTGTTTGTTSTSGSGSSGLLPTGGGRPSVFGSPLLAGYTTSGSAAQFGSLGSIPVGTAASESSVQALDASLGSRPGLVVFAAVLALAATAGCTVRQWVLRAVPALATPATVVPVTSGAHRR